ADGPWCQLQCGSSAHFQRWIAVVSNNCEDSDVSWNAKGEDNYTMAFSSRVFVDGIENSAVTAGLLGGSGGWPSRPSRGSARAAGFTDWEVGFDLSRPDGSKSLGGRLVRWAGAQIGPYSANASLGSTGQPGGRDFRFETESPQRHFVVAKEFDPTLDRKSLKFFINRRLNRGLVVALQRGPEPQQRALEFEAGRSRPAVSASAWPGTPLARAPDREIRLDLMAGSEGSVWAASATCEAPFLLDRMTLELRRELRRELDALRRRTSVSSAPHWCSDSWPGDRETARAQVGFERQLRRIDLLLETSGPTAGDARALSATVEMDVDSLDDESCRRRLRLFLGDVRIEVPSHGVNKSFKFVYRPMREFTCAGDNGSAISLRFAPGQRLDRFTVFASGNDRQAAPSRLTAALDTGLGGFDFPADLRASRRFGGGSGGPGFRPNATLVFASAGVSDDGRRAHAAVLVGRMQFGQWPDPAEPASVPAGLNLFSLGLRLHGNNSVEGSSAWRSERVDGVKSARRPHLKESLLDTWMASSLCAHSARRPTPCCGRAGERLLKSVDAKRLAEEATNPLLADLTALKLYAEAVVEAAAAIRGSAPSSSTACRCSPPGVPAWTPANPRAGLVSDWLSGCCLEVSDSFLRRMLSSGAAVSGRDGARDASVLRLLSERASQLLSLGSVNAEMAKALLQIELALQAAVSDSLGLLADDLLPFAIGHLGDLVRLKEVAGRRAVRASVVDRLRRRVGRGPAAGAASSAGRCGLAAAAGCRGRWATGATSKTAGGCSATASSPPQSARLLMTDAYGLRVWRPVCDAKCRESGDAAFAAVVGDVYPPVYLDSLSRGFGGRAWPEFDRFEQRRVDSETDCSLKRNGRPSPPRSKTVRRLVRAATCCCRCQRLAPDGRRPVGPVGAPAGDAAPDGGAGRRGRSLITFDGISLVNPLPCSYVLAHDFRLNEFTVAQSYRESERDGGAARPAGEVRQRAVLNQPQRRSQSQRPHREALPMSRYVGGRLVQAERKKSRLLVRFHGRDAAQHPAAAARVDGMAGSNDGHRANDLQGVAGTRTSATGPPAGASPPRPADPTPPLSPAVESPEAEANCQLWFSRRSFSFDKCFSTVNPRPYLDLCRAFARLGKDICEVAVQYTDRCRNELVNINTPYSCVRCRVDEETTIVKDDLISEPRVLRKRLQAVFLLENSDCVASAIGLRGSYISYLAKL
uniref:VWFD domain-containing protein n=1 Tax=Macrostomum lignano TaxID=282301 RepID=A0A1I8F9L9_9PLAT